MTGRQLPQLCDSYIEIPDDPWAGSYCKLHADHQGAHSAHYPVETGRSDHRPYVAADRPDDAFVPACTCGWRGDFGVDLVEVLADAKEHVASASTGERS